MKKLNYTKLAIGQPDGLDQIVTRQQLCDAIEGRDYDADGFSLSIGSILDAEDRARKQMISTSYKIDGWIWTISSQY